MNGRNIWPHDLEFLAESIPGVRFGNVSAFSFADDIGTDNVVMVVESRENNPAKRKELVEQLQALILLHFGVKCLINLVPPRTLPRTSSGKLSRSKAKQDFWLDIKRALQLSVHLSNILDSQYFENFNDRFQWLYWKKNS